MKTSLCHNIVIVDSKPLARGQHFLSLKAPELAAAARPGQFIHIRLPGEGMDPFLRRPLSIAAAFPAQGTILLFFRLTGRGTAALARLQKGQLLHCLGPLGKGYSWPSAKQKPLLVAGGIGVAPLWFLKQALQRKKIPFYFFWGASSVDHFFYLHDFNSKKELLVLATDDGSVGYHGPITKPVELFLQNKQGDVKIYACGPVPMLKSLQRIALHYGASLEISLEERMACGIGACLGCAVRVKAADDHQSSCHYSRVCADGPVFKGEEVILSDEPGS